MPYWVPAILGPVILIVVMIDIVWSTLSTHGAGPLSRRLTLKGWLFFRWLHRRIQSHRLLKANVVIILIANFFMWVLLLWAGWAMIFSVSESAVIHLETGEPAATVDRIYFTGMTLLTLGTGDFVAETPMWRLIMAIASLNGLVVITLVITYLLPVVSAEIDRRQLALMIWGLGEDATAIVINGWNDDNFSGLEDKLYDAAQLLTRHAERHLAYPILQFFHAADSQAELAARVVTLDDAATLLESCVDCDPPVSSSVLRTLRAALDRHLRRVELYHVSTADDPPPTPDFDAIRHSGVPLYEQSRVDAVFDDMADHRKLLQGFLRADGWSWGD
jgi:voltage-gated potassium channel Kch